MAITEVELKVSEEVAAGTDVCDTYTPANGVEVWLTFFHGEAAFTSNSSVMVLWDYGGAGETVIWSTNGSDRNNYQIELTGADGIKKVALCCSNAETGPLVLSGIARIAVV
jgi:hypothetical protein